MKKFTLVLSFVLSLAIGLKAQTYVGEIPGTPTIVPGFLSNNGCPYIEYSNRDSNTCSIYDIDFMTHITDIGINEDIIEVNYWYVINNAYTTSGSYSSQTLFNNDDSFEYVVGHDRDEWGGGYSYFTINSTNGNVLATIQAGNDYYWNGFMHIYIIENNSYLAITRYNHNGYSAGALYQISQTQGLIKLDAELPISVFPTVANRGQQITVELGENSNATEITVVNELGQVVKRVPVNGQSSVVIPTTGLGSGLNILNTNNAKGNGGCKIIIK